MNTTLNGVHSHNTLSLSNCSCSWRHSCKSHRRGRFQTDTSEWLTPDITLRAGRTFIALLELFLNHVNDITSKDTVKIFDGHLPQILLHFTKTIHDQFLLRKHLLISCEVDRFFVCF